MKMHGKKMFGPRIEVLVIPRQEGDLVFKAKAVLDYDPFLKLLPTPQPPVRMLPGGIKSVNTESPAYDKAMDEWAHLKWTWMILKSLEATETLEWETVEMDDPSTFDNYKAEMKDAGLSPAEVGLIQALVIDACGLNQVKIEQATKAFLAGRGQEQDVKFSPASEPNSTPSGEPVSVSA
jgi:hypothetical protein